MKILITVSTYYPDFNGVANVTKYLAEGLRKKGHDIQIITILSHNRKREEEINGIKVKRFILKFNKFTGYNGEIEEYRKFVSNFKCDIMINVCTQCSTTDVLLPILGKLKMKKILHVHGFSTIKLKPLNFYRGIKGFFSNLYSYIYWKKIYYFKFRKYVNEYDKIITLTKKDSSRQYLDEYYRNGKIEVLENAVDNIFLEDTKEYATELEKYGIYKDDKYLLSVANYSPVKNQKLLLDVFYKANIDNSYKLIMVGNNHNIKYYKKLLKHYEELKKRIRKKQVIFITDIERKMIPYIVKNAKVYLVTSISEEYSISILEAMSQKVPFISTNVGNVSELKGGIVVNNERQMINELENLLSNEEKIAKLGLEGYNYVINNCTIDKAIKKIECIINDIGE